MGCEITVRHSLSMCSQWRGTSRNPARRLIDVVAVDHWLDACRSWLRFWSTLVVRLPRRLWEQGRRILNRLRRAYNGNIRSGPWALRTL